MLGHSRLDRRCQHTGWRAQVDVATVGGGQQNAALDEQFLVALEVVHHAVDPVLVPGRDRVDLPGRDVGQ